MKRISQKRVISLTITALVLVIAMTFSVVAFAWEHPNNDSALNVSLYYNQMETYSGAAPDPYMYFEGKNNDKSRSSGKIYFIAQRSNENQKYWHNDVSYLVNVGTYLAKQKTNDKDSDTWWRLCLKNEEKTGGTGYGWIW